MASLSNPLLLGHQNLRLDPSKVIPLDENNCTLVTNTFAKYIYSDLKNTLFWDAININFKYWTKKNWKAMNGNIWNKIKKCCISCGIWIDQYGNNGTQSKILVKFILTKYDDDLKIEI